MQHLKKKGTHKFRNAPSPPTHPSIYPPACTHNAQFQLISPNPFPPSLSCHLIRHLSESGHFPCGQNTQLSLAISRQHLFVCEDNWGGPYMCLSVLSICIGSGVCLNGSVCLCLSLWAFRSCFPCRVNSVQVDLITWRCSLQSEVVLWCNLSAAGLNKATANHTDCHCMYVCSFQKLLPNWWGEGVTEPNSFQELFTCERGKWLYCTTCNGKVLLLVLLHDSGFMTSQWHMSQARLACIFWFLGDFRAH